MHHKALLFQDGATALEILKAGSPRKAKSLGRAVANFDEDVWKEHRERIVREGNYFKFTKAVNEDGMGLRDRLLSTGDRELVEASPFDPV
jgi:ribA/ribD-fused uncharacterized protein